MHIVVTKENIVLPWKMLFNPETSITPFFAGIEETSVNLPGVDGERQVSSKYLPITHELVLRSPPYVMIAEKRLYEKKLSNFVVYAKENEVELHYQRRERTYFAKAVSFAEKAQEYATWVEYKIVLKSHDPIGYSKMRMINAKGKFSNKGNTTVNTKMIFSGPVSNPSIVVNGETFKYTGAIGGGNILIIDSKDYTATMHNKATSVSTNVNSQWSGNFFTLRPGFSELQNITNADGKVEIVWRDGWL